MSLDCWQFLFGRWRPGWAGRDAGARSTAGSGWSGGRSHPRSPAGRQQFLSCSLAPLSPRGPSPTFPLKVEHSCKSKTNLLTSMTKVCKGNYFNDSHYNEEFSKQTHRLFSKQTHCKKFFIFWTFYGTWWFITIAFLIVITIVMHYKFHGQSLWNIFSSWKEKKTKYCALLMNAKCVFFLFSRLAATSRPKNERQIRTKNFWEGLSQYIT